MMEKFYLEFLLHAYNSSLKAVKSSLLEFAENLEVAQDNQDSAGGNNFKVSLTTEDPTVIFDICGQFGRISSIKVDEIK